MGGKLGEPGDSTTKSSRVSPHSIFHSIDV